MAVLALAVLYPTTMHVDVSVVVVALRQAVCYVRLTAGVVVVAYTILGVLDKVVLDFASTNRRSSRY